MKYPKSYDLLIKEYEIALNSAKGHETSIWQLGLVLGFGSIGSLALLINSDKVIDPEITTGLAIIVAAVAYCWYKMAARLWSIQHTEFLRMSHIESRLPVISRQKYIRRRDHIKEFPKEMDKALPIETLSEKEIAQIDDVKHYNIYGTRYYSKFIIGIIWIAWAIYIIIKTKTIISIMPFSFCFPNSVYIVIYISSIIIIALVDKIIRTINSKLRTREK